MLYPYPNFSAVPNSQQATLKLIANQLGCSVTTVSRTLSGQASRYRISKATEASVSQLAAQLNFVPNPIARGLRLKKTQTIGLVIPDISNPFFAGIAHAVTLGARKLGYSIILCDSQGDNALEAKSIALLKSQHVDGIVVSPVGLSADHLLALAKWKLPVVCVDRYFPGVPLHFVGSDNLGSAREATRFFIQHGHRHIACLQGLQGTLTNQLRLRGYREVLAEQQLAVDDGLIVGDAFTEQSGYMATKHLLQTRPEVTAILAFSNQNAFGALQALAEEKRRIPEDISLISFDDQPYLAHLATPMTTVAQPYAEMGEVAVNWLCEQIQSPRPPVPGGVLLPTRLMVRRSVKTLS